MKTKICNKCKKSLPATIEHFNMNNKKDGLRGNCRECTNKYHHRYYQQNKKRIIQKTKQYGRTKRGRAVHKKAIQKYRSSERGKAKQRVASKQWRQTEKGQKAIQTYWLKYTYGLTPEQHEQMYINQNGCCAMCKTSIPYEDIKTDHNHKTGKVRELLCRRCNSGLGYIEDKEFVEKARQYLKNNPQ